MTQLIEYIISNDLISFLGSLGVTGAIAKVLFEERRDKVFWSLRMKKTDRFLRIIIVAVVGVILLIMMGSIALAINSGLLNWVAGLVTVIMIIIMGLMGEGVKRKITNKYFLVFVKFDFAIFIVFMYSYFYSLGLLCMTIMNTEGIVIEQSIPAFLWLLSASIILFFVVLYVLYNPVLQVKAKVHYVIDNDLEYRIEGTLSNGMIIISKFDEKGFIPKKDDFFYDKLILEKESNIYWEDSEVPTININNISTANQKSTSS